MKKDKSIKKSKNKNLTPFAIIILVILILYALSILFTLYFGILTSFKSYTEFTYGNIITGAKPNYLGFPNISYNKELASITGVSYNFFDNYKIVFQSFKPVINGADKAYYTMSGRYVQPATYVANFGHFLLNTGIYALICPMLTAFTTMTMAYLCSKYKFGYSKFWYTLSLVTMIIPLVGTQTATVNMLRQFGLYDTYFSMIIMNIHGGGMYFFVFYAYFQGLSDTYVEAAEIDGASQLSVFVKIIIPLAWKTLITVYVINMVALWNTYEAPLMYYPTKPTLAYAVYLMSYGTDFSLGGVDKVVLQSAPVKFAGCMILSIPTLVMFICLKNIIMGNLTLGGLKE